MKDKPYPDIDWKSLLRRVRARAINLFRAEGLIYGDEASLEGLGKSPEDLAHDALIELFGRIDKYDADTEGKCFALANRILERRFLDAVSKNRAYITSAALTDEEFADIPASPRLASKKVEVADIAKKLYRYTDGDPQLEELIDAAALLAVEQKATIQHNDLATLLRTTVEDVRRRLARLEYRVEVLSFKQNAP